MDAAEKTVSTVRHFDRKVHSMPETNRGLQGYRGMAPTTTTRFGIPWEWLCAVTMGCLMLGCPETASYVVVLFNGYLRPGEGSDCLVEDLVKPIVTKDGKTKLGLCIAPAERGVATKTRTFDRAVYFDTADIQLETALLKFAGNRKGKEKLFKLTTGQHASNFSAAAELVGLGPEDLELYQCRHGGPSRDAMLSRKTMTEIQDRGDWQTLKSVQRYRKTDTHAEGLVTNFKESARFLQQGSRQTAVSP